MYIKRILLFIALAGLVVLGFFAYNIYQSIFSPNTGFEKESETLYIPTNASYETVIDSLKPHLQDIPSFDAVARKKGYASGVKPGKYIIPKGANNNEIINILRSGNKPVKLVFNNQERLENLAGRIAGQIEADSISLLQVMKDEEYLAQNDFNVENALGMYIPNQYEFFWNTSAEGFRTRMKREYNNFWNAERLKKAEEIGLTPHEVVVVASIVQKETAKIDERPKVAGVYLNRIKTGMKLDADPTVIYALKLQQQNFDTIIKR